MKKLIIILIIMINLRLFGFSLSSLDFEENLSQNQKVEKTYILKNNTKYVQRYRLSTTADNIEVRPKTFILDVDKEKEITITAIGRGKKGENRYFFIIEENIVNRKKLKKNQSGAYLNKTVRIEQSYYMK